MNDVSALSQPHVRHELQIFLSELQAADPRATWRAERVSGLASGIDQVFHFFFDDNDFDEGAVGVSLLSEVEVRGVAGVKQALEQVLAAVGDADDDAFVGHPLWAGVRQAVEAAELRTVTDPNVR
ncbi:hypothetical protein FHS79_003130 [Polymorphobacter multimanifer]|uniref:Uncharacterized protein n=1 Tax=Polymorphobacter multimanifer TaxID=1070431 RepID=A0A841L9W6_9SPHN|nr:hypothetical protein [Polymorphobacter multimanifer]MBB6228936.1 hypothetical protein [Polymorphobacter multimanifer]